MYKQKASELEEKIKANNDALEKLKDTTGDTTEEQQKLTEEAKKLATAQDENNKKLEAAEAGVTKWEGKLYTAQTALNNTNAEIKKNDQYLKEAENSTENAATSIDKYGHKAQDAGDYTQGMGEAVCALAAQLAAAGLKRAFEEIVEALQKCVDVSRGL